MQKIQKKAFSEPDVIILEHLSDLAVYEQICDGLVNRGFRILDPVVTRGVIPLGINPVGYITPKFGYDPLLAETIRSGCNVIRIGRFPNPESDAIIHSILPDRRAIGAMAADHFADRNFQDIAFAGNDPWGEDPPLLYYGFRDRVKERGCTCHLFQMRDTDIGDGSRAPLKEIQDSVEYREEQIYEWAKSLPKPVAVFTYNDRRLSLLYTTLKKFGFQIPDEIALLGVGNTYYCRSVPVQFSSIDMNFEGMAKATVDLMIRLINGENPPIEPVYVPPKEVVVRQSSNLMAVSDPVVSRAIRFIWDNFTDQLSIDDVASAAAVSRSLITRKFRKSLGRTVNSEIQRKRLEYAKQLLREGDLTILDVAESAGFQSATYFNTVFSKAFGITPGSYRTKHCSL